jgi:hypothetical protein
MEIDRGFALDRFRCYAMQRPKPTIAPTRTESAWWTSLALSGNLMPLLRNILKRLPGIC